MLFHFSIMLRDAFHFLNNPVKSTFWAHHFQKTSLRKSGAFFQLQQNPVESSVVERIYQKASLKCKNKNIAKLKNIFDAKRLKNAIFI
jgi:hypothetical protein